MHPRRSLVPLLLAIILSLAPGGDRALAQQDLSAEAERTVTEKLGVEVSQASAQSLLETIRADVEARARYLRMLESASREDSLVLKRQLQSRQIHSLKTLHTLASVLVELEKGEPVPRLRESVETMFATVGPFIGPVIHEYQRQIDKLRAQRLSTPAEERPLLELRIARQTRMLDTGFKIWDTHVQRMELLGLDPGPMKEDLREALLARADRLSGRIALAQERVEVYSKLSAESPDDSGLKYTLSAARKSMDNGTTSLKVVVDLMDHHEFDTKEYRAQLVAATRDITTGLLDRNVIGTLLAQWRDSVAEWFAEKGPRVLLRTLIFLLILLVFRLLSRVARKLTERLLASRKVRLSQLLTRMLISTAGNLVMLLGLIVALAQAGVSLGPMMAGLGVVGFILGFALQDSLGNFAAGMMILIYRPYDVGDLVDINGVFGKVDKMSLVSTTILTIDNQTLVVPNNKIWGDVIKNVTAQRIRRVDMTFSISYEDDIPRAESIFEEILKSHPKVLEDPESMVRLHQLGDSSVDFVVRPWVKTDDYWDVYWDVTRAVKLRLDEEGITIPFPQRTLHIREPVPTEHEQHAPVSVAQEESPDTSQSSLDSPSDDDSDS